MSKAIKTGWIALLLLGNAPSACAQLDAGLQKPYQLQVVLQVAENRVLTPLFQMQLQNELRAQLALGLGRLAQVEVVRTHPLLRAVEERGLENGLEGQDVLDEVKTHFVLVSYQEGRYEIKGRQYDGWTGLTSSVVRQGQTTDRALVAQIAAQLVERDFGLGGTVVGAEGEIKVALRGGDLGVDLESWLQPGEVLAVSRITQEGGQMRGRGMEWVFLEVLDKPRQGICRCQLWNRFKEDNLRAEPGVLGYRCLKLTTIQGPVKLRLVDRDTFRGLEGLQVRVHKPGQKGKEGLSSDREGLVVTKETFKHLALADVLSGEVMRAQLPIALVDERPVVCRLKITNEAEGAALWELRKDQWLGRLYDLVRLEAEQRNQLNGLLARSLDEALQHVRTWRKNLGEELDQLSLEREKLLKLARDKKVQRVDLREGEQRLAELREGQKKLDAMLARLEEAVQDSATGKSLGLAGMLERARLLESEANFEQALQLYRRILDLHADQGKLKTHYQMLQKAWLPRDDKHAEARQYIFQTWPGLEPKELGNHLEIVREKWGICQQAQDRLTARKLVQTNIGHAANLKRALDALRRQDTEDSRAQAKVIAQVAENLRRLHGEVVEFLKTP
jgi:hypothetical protein